MIYHRRASTPNYRGRRSAFLSITGDTVGVDKKLVRTLADAYSMGQRLSDIGVNNRSLNHPEGLIYYATSLYS